ncbi:MAG TPA: RnfABCDGE type electron transport complex subunit D [Candidatus Methylomirabilis sp.]|nr:RnfABCDGE type electron transport complex subunit D [Candidatus Methylomirabilis sp.]
MAATATDGRHDTVGHRRRWDPRLYQISVLAGLVLYGLGRLGFDLPGAHAVIILATVLLVQFAATRLSGLSRFDPKSALISGLSLCLLLRTNSLELVIVTAAVAIASKFVVRIGGKHVFNPTNVALVAMMLLTGQVWVSPGQWGSTAVFGFLLASAGGLVVNRAARSDVTVTFLAAYAALLIGRSLWLGEPLSIPVHRLESGALVLFAFFMISDPKTTPDSRTGRMLFATLVAAGAWVIQFKLFRTNGLLWSLALFSLIVPLIDRLLPGRRYAWDRPAGLPTTTNGDRHEAHDPRYQPAAPHALLDPRGAGLLRILRRQG